MISESGSPMSGGSPLLLRVVRRQEDISLPAGGTKAGIRFATRSDIIARRLHDDRQG
ncbi:MAG: hypothetical protein ABIJ16_10640 [Bacteroidota bacterium]